MEKITYQELIMKLNPLQVEFRKIIQDCEIDGILLLTSDSATIQELTNNSKNLIVQFNQLRRQVTQELDQSFIDQQQLESIESLTSYQESTTVSTIASTIASTTASTTASPIVADEDDPLFPKIWPNVFLFPEKKVCWDLQQFLSCPNKLKEKLKLSEDKKKLTFLSGIIDVLYIEITQELNT